MHEERCQLELPGPCLVLDSAGARRAATELLDLFQMGDELEANTAFCAKHTITHVGDWARARLGEDKLSELKEMTAEYFLRGG